MKSKLSILLLLVLFLIITTSSCKRKQILMNITFGLSEREIKVEAKKMASDKELIMEIKNDDTTFFRNLEIEGSIFKSRIYFNSDRLGSGPLRSYDYSLTTLPFAETGNDTTSKDGYKVTHWTVFKATDFNKLKSFLDKKYGNGFFSTKEGSFGNDTLYKYGTENADLYLTHGKIENGIFWGVPIKIPFYTTAYIEVRGKSYDSEFKKENERRRKELTPEQIVSVLFDAPYLKDDFDETGNKVKYIIVKANMENYDTYVIDNDITECKGILSITDAFNDTLKKGELVYKFKRPLTSPQKNQWSVMDYNAFKLGWPDPAFVKISNMISSGTTLKVRFKPTAVVLDNGDVIK